MHSDLSLDQQSRANAIQHIRGHSLRNVPLLSGQLAKLTEVPNDEPALVPLIANLRFIHLAHYYLSRAFTAVGYRTSWGTHRIGLPQGSVEQGSRAGPQQYQNAYSPSANFGASNFDVRNAFKGYVVYELPFR